MSTDQPPFRDPRLPARERADDLLGRLTLDERIAMLHQFAPAVERLGVSAFRTGQEALHGVAWMGPATVFPQAVGLGATWNDDLVRRVGEAVGREARAMRARDPRVGLNVWSPTVNLLRHPLWGRNEEGYAEDPHLTAALATAYTRGLCGDHPTRRRTAPVLKHWLAHNNETDRDTSSASVRPRVLHEYELPAFRGPVRAGAVAGVMPAYNLVNGRPNHLSPLLAEQLRTWCDHELVVCSDAGAPSNLAGSQGYFADHEEATAAALRAGVDSLTDHGEDSSTTVARVRGALARGLLEEVDIDTAVRRLLAMRVSLGEFDPASAPASDAAFDAASAPASDAAFDAAFDTPEHRALAREAAEQAIVLLRNDGLLPLAEGTRVAVVGLLADECKLDWYSGTLLRRSTPLDGLRERFGADRVTFAEGADRVRLRCRDGWLTAPEAGTGEDGADDPAAAGALDPALLSGRIDLPPLGTAAEPVGRGEFALVDWGGGVLTLRASCGRHLSVAEDGFVRASAEQPGGWVVRETFELRPYGGGHLLWHRGTGRYLTVAADGARTAADGEEGTVFAVETVERGEDAVRAAAGADVVVVVAGNDPHINGRETEDRATLALPDQQDRLWRAAHDVNPRTALVLVSAYPYAVGGADAALPALLWTAHGGQAAGEALAAVLSGDVPPGGRLPQTWYASDADLPALLDYDVIGSRTTYLYFDGTPLYPFGHGLSYTSFSYGEVTAAHDGETLTARCTVANTGAATGDEVVQLYVRAVDVAGPELPRPHRALAGHRRIRLAPGASQEVEFAVPLAEALGFWDVAHDRWAVAPGTYGVDVGSSGTDVRATATVRVDGPAPGPRPMGNVRAADYDEQRGTELVDLSRERGDAVAPTGRGEAELVFLDCDFGSGPGSVTVEAAREEPGEATVVLRPEGAAPVALTVPCTEDRYAYATVRAELPEPPTGVGELRVTLHGSLRLARLGFGDPSFAESA